MNGLRGCVLPSILLKYGFFKMVLPGYGVRACFKLARVSYLKIKGKFY